jgi:sigma-B regulation protein RsbU (phosphoserine phosphatase)
MSRRPSPRIAKLPPEHSSPARARRFVEDALHDSCSPDVIEAATLLVSELATNVVVHAGTPMWVSVHPVRGGVRVEVADGARNLPVVDLRTARREPPGFAQSGRGLVLVDRMARRWGVERHHTGKAVWFELGATRPRSPRRRAVVLLGRLV